MDGILTWIKEIVVNYIIVPAGMTSFRPVYMSYTFAIITGGY